jgi:hypothetical protein
MLPLRRRLARVLLARALFSFARAFAPLSPYGLNRKAGVQGKLEFKKIAPRT